MNDPFPWWPIALAELGTTETKGDKHTARVLEYLKATSLDATLASKDETPWCSAFANWCLNQSGRQGTGSAWARSWLQWGRPARWEELASGAVVVLDRPGGGPGAGHVGFLDFARTMTGPTDTIYLLGGNQGDAVRVSAYPLSRLLGVRVPG